MEQASEGPKARKAGKLPIIVAGLVAVGAAGVVASAVSALKSSKPAPPAKPAKAVAATAVRAATSKRSAAPKPLVPKPLSPPEAAAAKSQAPAQISPGSTASAHATRSVVAAAAAAAAAPAPVAEQQPSASSSRAVPEKNMALNQTYTDDSIKPDSVAANAPAQTEAAATVVQAPAASSNPSSADVLVSESSREAVKLDSEVDELAITDAGLAADMEVGSDVEELAAAEETSTGGEAEEVSATAAEAEAEQLMMQAMSAWNVQGNRQLGVRLARQALSALEAGEHRPKVRSEVCSSLADMLYAQQQWDEALAAVSKAMEAAKEAGDWGLAVKLSNNMGAVYKKLGKLADAEALHRDSYALANRELGAGHPLTLLARSNVIEVLSEKEQWQEARELLMNAISVLGEEAKQYSGPQAQAVVGDAKEPAKVAPQLRRIRAATIRAFVELGRLEMTAGEDAPAAESAYRSALDMCNEEFGSGSAESSGPMFSLANCLRAIGKKDEAYAMYEELYSNLSSRDGLGEETAVHLARALADLAEEKEDWGALDKYSTSALNSMILLIGTKTHPVLESFYQAACRAKTKNGDGAGAEVLRRQFLSGVLRMTQQQARQGARSTGLTQARKPKKSTGRK